MRMTMATLFRALGPFLAFIGTGLVVYATIDPANEQVLLENIGLVLFAVGFVLYLVGRKQTAA